MKALAIDCAVSRLAVAAKNENISAKIVLDIGIKQSEKLLPAIDYVMKETGLCAKELDYSAVTTGPGTFTGLRLGLSALKALTLSSNIPLYGIPSLDAYAWPYRKAIETVLPVIEAKEDEFFYSFFIRGEKLRAEEDAGIEEILKQLDTESPVLACGPAGKIFCERTAEISPLYSLHSFSPDEDCCNSLFEIAEKMISEKKEPLKDYDGPLYVRKSEAEIVLEAKNRS
ncbi:tRNA (adenosine(37)-N6)-threonylcarbamoyltransferase complex dimerization subunit type 1 TsaB [Treponema sp.]|uniref:tRNA (adenosine(37)-N6)-threonylcarbamoyltransferase complex dimerization subunit type 1 TsaB n=1 Tax=Treponema sp. TaxID=166 RepID=UPI003F005ACF